MEDRGDTYEIVSYWEKLTADYLRISVLEVEELDYLDYLLYRRDAFIHRLNETEAGQEYLANAYRLEQTSMGRSDRARLRELFGPKTGGEHVSHKT